MGKRIRYILAFLGAALDIRDMGGLIRNAIGGTTLGTITSAVLVGVTKMPVPSLALIASSVFLASLLMIPTILRNRVWFRPTLDSLPTPQDVLNDLDQWIRSEITYVHFGWLWTDDPYILFGILISNYSKYDIEITGVEGNTIINDTPCTRDAKIPAGFTIAAIPKHTFLTRVSFLQPLQEAHAKKLQARLSTGVPIPFDLGSVGWTGVIALPTEKVPFPRRFPCAAPFEVDGSRITPEHSQANVRRNRLVGTGPEVVKP